ncbi:unnamed protein product, partial [Prorocentrum cordatum]
VDDKTQNAILIDLIYSERPTSLFNFGLSLDPLMPLWGPTDMMEETRMMDQMITLDAVLVADCVTLGMARVWTRGLLLLLGLLVEVMIIVLGTMPSVLGVMLTMAILLLICLRFLSFLSTLMRRSCCYLRVLMVPTYPVLGDLVMILFSPLVVHQIVLMEKLRKFYLARSRGLQHPFLPKDLLVLQALLQFLLLLPFSLQLPSFVEGKVGTWRFIMMLTVPYLLFRGSDLGPLFVVPLMGSTGLFVADCGCVDPDKLAGTSWPSWALAPWTRWVAFRGIGPVVDLAPAGVWIKREGSFPRRAGACGTPRLMTMATTHAGRWPMSAAPFGRAEGSGYEVECFGAGDPCLSWWINYHQGCGFNMVTLVILLVCPGPASRPTSLAPAGAQMTHARGSEIPSGDEGLRRAWRVTPAPLLAPAEASPGAERLAARTGPAGGPVVSHDDATPEEDPRAFKELGRKLSLIERGHRGEPKSGSGAANQKGSEDLRSHLDGARGPSSSEHAALETLTSDLEKCKGDGGGLGHSDDEESDEERCPELRSMARAADLTVGGEPVARPDYLHCRLKALRKTVEGGRASTTERPTLIPFNYGGPSSSVEEELAADTEAAEARAAQLRGRLRAGGSATWARQAAGRSGGIGSAGNPAAPRRGGGPDTGAGAAPESGAAEDAATPRDQPGESRKPIEQTIAESAHQGRPPAKNAARAGGLHGQADRPGPAALSMLELGPGPMISAHEGPLRVGEFMKRITRAVAAAARTFARATWLNYLYLGQLSRDRRETAGMPHWPSELQKTRGCCNMGEDCRALPRNHGEFEFGLPEAANVGRLFDDLSETAVALVDAGSTIADVSGTHANGTGADGAKGNEFTSCVVAWPLFGLRVGEKASERGLPRVAQPSEVKDLLGEAAEFPRKSVR